MVNFQVVKGHVTSIYDTFLIKDRLEKGEERLKHCKTEDMIGDFFTKPLQGSMFVRYQDMSMNINDTLSNAIKAPVLSPYRSELS
jgi:hypothetical protein